VRGITLKYLCIVAMAAGCTPTTSWMDEPAPLPPEGRPIDATTSRVASSRGDRVATHSFAPWIDRRNPPVKPPDPDPGAAPSPGDWNYDVRSGGSGTVNAAPALFASGLGHTCQDRLYVPVNVSGGPNLYAFNNLYEDASVTCPEPMPADPLCSPSANGHCPTRVWRTTLSGRLDGNAVSMDLDGSELYVNTTTGIFYVVDAMTGTTASFDARTHVGSANATFLNSTPFVDYVYHVVYTALDYQNNTRCRIYRFDPTDLQNPTFVDLTDTGCRASVVYWNGFVYIGGSETTFPRGRLHRVDVNGRNMTVSGAPWPVTLITDTARGAPITSAPTLDVQDGGQDYVFMTNNDFLTVTRVSDGATTRYDNNGNGQIGYNTNPSTPFFDFTTRAVFAARENDLRRIVFAPAAMTLTLSATAPTQGQGTDLDPYSSPVMYMPVGTNYVYIGDGDRRLNRWNADTMSNRLTFSIGGSGGTRLRSPIVIDYADGNIYFGADNGRVYQITQSQLQ
jgi:hypothetical protein